MLSLSENSEVQVNPLFPFEQTLLPSQLLQHKGPTYQATSQTTAIPLTSIQKDVHGIICVLRRQSTRPFTDRELYSHIPPFLRVANRSSRPKPPPTRQADVPSTATQTPAKPNDNRKPAPASASPSPPRRPIPPTTENRPPYVRDPVQARPGSPRTPKATPTDSTPTLSDPILLQSSISRTQFLRQHRSRRFNILIIATTGYPPTRVVVMTAITRTSHFSSFSR